MEYMAPKKRVTDSHQISGVVLAGGLGRRMGGVDKGLQSLRGRPMVAWVVERLAPQVDELFINANQNAGHYAAFGHRVVPDRIADFAGPLAGLHVALSMARYPLVATVPCDSPFLPGDLVSRLLSGLTAADADFAVARTFDQPHPVFCLCKSSLLVPLTRYLEEGGRRFEAWYSTLNSVAVQFDDVAEAFENINTRQDLERFERS